MLTNRLREIKDDWGVTEKAIARGSGIPQTTVHKLIYRMTHVPTSNALEALAKFFHLDSPLELLTWVPPKES